jgi:hypothetical protein
MKRGMFLAVLALLLLPACGGTDRPEGVVERWLISLNQGKAGEPEKYAPDAISQRILPDWQQRDPGDLDVIEVGRGEIWAEDLYDVPFRVRLVNGKEVFAIARLRGGYAFRAPDGSVHLVSRQVNELLPADAGRQARLPLPSQGGERIGSASARVWLAALGIAVAFVLLSVLLMSTVGRKARVSG